VPDKAEFPGTGVEGNGIAAESQADWLRFMKSGGCVQCHQLGNKATREMPEALGHFDSSVAAWDRRVQSGQAGTNMTSDLSRLGPQRALQMFADWTDRIAAGEVPPAPPRPQGLERNVVVTLWDWADPKGYLHDEVSTDRRNPAVNANGRIYGSMELSQAYLPVLDPATHTTSRVELTVRDPSTQPAPSPFMLEPSPYWGDEVIWTSKNNVHNPMLDERGRVWLTSAVRPPANPEFCREGSEHASAKLFPLNQANRHLAAYDPQTGGLTHISTCFSTHHLMFAEDANNTLWTSGGGQVVGWLNRKMFDETGDEEASQGWTALILDTNGNGQRDAYVEPDQPVDATMDKRITAPFYGVAPAPDGSVWGSYQGSPGGVVRLNPGSNPPETTLAEVYEVPWNNPRVPNIGFSPRGMDIDRNGVILDSVSERTPGQFRPAQVRGAPQRADRDRPALPRRVDLLPGADTSVQRRHGSGQRGGQLLHLGRPVRHVRAWRKHPDQHRQWIRRAAGPQGRAVGRAPSPLSAGVLREVDGWPYRRSERRLEG